MTIHSYTSRRIVDGNTKIFGVVGDPIAQIKTPELINPIFAEMGQNVICVPLHISAAELSVTWKGLQALKSLVGFGVTLPHKQEAARLCDHLEPNAVRVGVANCIRREEDGAMTGELFDGVGFVGGLRAAGHDLQGVDALMVGAGGAASAIAFALADAGVGSLAIANRTQSKADALCDQVNKALRRDFARPSRADPAGFALIINSTSLGLNPDDPLPVDVSRISSGALVAEVIAKPEISPLLVAAEEKGATVHSGIYMVRNQVREIARFVCRL